MIFAASAFDHVLDSLDWHIFEVWHWELHLPGFRSAFGGKGFGITKYTIIMMLAAGLICGIYIPLARRIQTGEAPKGTFWNLFESILTFIRDEIAKPYIGKDADRYVHYLWTVFLFVLTCNLFGMVPFFGSPTASFATTMVLAFGSFLFIHVSSVMRFGALSHFLSFAPHLEMPFAMRVGISLMLWPIEFLGLIIKCFVLSVRLFANLFAGHMVLATIMLFIPAVRGAGEGLEWTVTIASVVGVVLLSMLELFVAFLQAYLFTFLTGLFLGGVLEHAEHYSHELAGGHGHGHGHGDHGHGHEDHGQSHGGHGHAH